MKHVSCNILLFIYTKNYPAKFDLLFQVLLAVVTVTAVGQVLKPFTSALRGKGFNWKLSISSGGMPSVHSAVGLLFYFLPM